MPKDIIFISESGIKTAQDIKELERNAVDGVLIGETLMRAKVRVQALQQLKIHLKICGLRDRKMLLMPMKCSRILPGLCLHRVNGR